MKRLIAGATGFVGKHIVKNWLSENIEVTILGRSVDKIEKIYGNGVRAIDWKTFEKIKSDEIKYFNAIVNLSGTNIGDKKWTSKRKTQILDSRVNSTRIISKKLDEISIEFGVSVSLRLKISFLLGEEIEGNN